MCCCTNAADTRFAIRLGQRSLEPRQRASVLVSCIYFLIRLVAKHGLAGAARVLRGLAKNLMRGRIRTAEQ